MSYYEPDQQIDLTKQEKIELIWEEIKALETEQDDIDWRLMELKSELHDIQMGVL